MEANISCPVPKQLNYHPTSCQNGDGVSTLVLLYNDCKQDWGAASEARL